MKQKKKKNRVNKAEYVESREWNSPKKVRQENRLNKSEPIEWHGWIEGIKLNGKDKTREQSE